jgi:hypothetical protein
MDVQWCKKIYYVAQMIVIAVMMGWSCAVMYKNGYFSEGVCLTCVVFS